MLYDPYAFLLTTKLLLYYIIYYDTCKTYIKQTHQVHNTMNQIIIHVILMCIKKAKRRYPDIFNQTACIWNT
jgi:hypothetical protein